MNRSAIKARLSDIIEFVMHEQEKHPTRWYPIKGLQTLLSDIGETDDKNIYEHTYGIEYIMGDQFHSYHDIVFEMVLKLCFDIDRMIALRHALDILKEDKNSTQIIQMKQLLLQWASSYPENGDILQEIEIRYRDVFVKLINIAPQYWYKVFPLYILRTLSLGSNYMLLTPRDCS
ncbi:MAG: hypothetical protein ACYDCO_17085 [Armatimonadota bacterium]